MENNKVVKPTKFKCQTKFECKNDFAEFYCKNCKLNFCLKCKPKHNSHKSAKLKVFDDEDLCESTCKETTANLADITCGLCNKRFCWNCFQENDKEHFNKRNFSKFELDHGGSNEFHTIQLTSMPPRIMIFDEEEHFKFQSAPELADMLNVKPTEKLLVISIMGRTGDGKSHCLNQTFFGGMEIFQTDPGQTRCTVGAWAAVTKKHGYLLIDTEGLQGESKNPSQQKRLLMKILAVSDLVIYRTKDSRLNQEIFNFISDASVAFDKYFRHHLENKAEEFQCKPESLAPSFLLVHSVDHTNIVENYEMILDRIRNTHPNKVLTFSNIFYEGRKVNDKATEDSVDYKKLEIRIDEIFKTKNIRKPRTCEFIFSCMHMLNQIFNKNVTEKPQSIFPDEFFSCGSQCESCSKKCELSMNHAGRHRNASSCVLTSKLQNYVYLCKACSHGSSGPEKFLVPKPMSSSESTLTGAFGYFWRGVVIECEKCGILYKSRENWFYNESPDKHPNLIQKVIHYWPGDHSLITSVHPIGQRCVDSVTELSSELSKWSNPTLKVVKDTIVDAYLPQGMQPNSEIKNCPVCKRDMDTLTHPVHHCRLCRQGVCDKCSDYFVEFARYGKQRVCENCHEKSKTENMTKKSLPEETNTFKAIQIANKTTSILGSLARAPFSVAKMVVQPSYWQSDSECKKCPICEKKFDSYWLPIHHCRACGKGVCDPCSLSKLPVPLRGIDNPQRVCDKCYKEKRYELPSE